MQMFGLQVVLRKQQTMHGKHVMGIGLAAGNRCQEQLTVGISEDSIHASVCGCCYLQIETGTLMD
jgi:hypothetical protein